jgi:hypothetical protein
MIEASQQILKINTQGGEGKDRGGILDLVDVVQIPRGQQR